MSHEDFKNYINYVSILIKEQAKEAKFDADNPKEGDRDYNTGHLMAYYSVLTLLKNQAPIFNISQEEIGLSDMDPDMDLLGLHRRTDIDPE